jgi:5'-deoxynucleotidase YfbR-like HD superfamily hydrolase
MNTTPATPFATRVANTLEAGRVLRYHAVPSVRPQSVSCHSWGVLILVLAICPDASRELVLEAALHDTGELYTGDVPFTVKRDCPDIKARFDELEDVARTNWLMADPQTLNAHDAAVLKLADTLEGFIWCRKTELVGPVRDRWVLAFRVGLEKFISRISDAEMSRALALYAEHGGEL